MRNTPLGTGSPGDRLSEKAQVDCLIILIARDSTHEAPFGPGIPKFRALPAAAFLRSSSASRLQLCYGEEEVGGGGGSSSSLLAHRVGYQNRANGAPSALIDIWSESQTSPPRA